MKRPQLSPTSPVEKAAETHRIAVEPSQVLVVEDNDDMRRLLWLMLQREGYRVLTAGNGQEALQLFADHPVDLVLLDINLPVLNGYAVCMELRKQSYVPIIFVTVKTRADDLITGLGLGADQYITKPFVIAELRARIRAILHRVQHHTRARSATLRTIGDLALDEDRQEVTVRGRRIGLTLAEFRLLRYLMRNPNQLITKEEMRAAVWEYQAVDDTFVRVTVHRLRAKLEVNPTQPDYLQTVPHVGYQLCPEGASRHAQ